MRMIIDKNLLVSSYMPFSLRLKCASHWVDEFNNERVKIPAGLKLYYEYRWNSYKYHNEKGCEYIESNKKCADMLGLSVSSIENNYNPLLKKMGLLQINPQGDCVFFVTVFSLADIKGFLINPNLCKQKSIKKFEYDEKINHEQLKILEHNKRQALKVKSEKNEKCYLVTAKQHRDLIELRRELRGFNDE